MNIELEIIGIGVVMLSPVYGALWYLIILGTKNRAAIDKLKQDIERITERLDSCKYCIKGTIT